MYSINLLSSSLKLSELILKVQFICNLNFFPLSTQNLYDSNLRILRTWNVLVSFIDFLSMLLSEFVNMAKCEVIILRFENQLRQVLLQALFVN